jgi:NAD(P)H-dependent FMN reductase
MSKDKIRIVAFAGSTRKDSLNKKLLRIAAEGAKDAGAEVTIIDLKDYPMPLYDGDLEAESGIPENALKLKKIFQDHHGFLIASPEYNSGYSAVLKNTIDWISRPSSKDEPMLSAFNGKTATIMAASPGALGGLRGLYQLRELLMNMNVTVLPQMRAVGKAMQEFNDKGEIESESLSSQIKELGKNTVKAIKLG